MGSAVLEYELPDLERAAVDMVTQVVERLFQGHDGPFPLAAAKSVIEAITGIPAEMIEDTHPEAHAPSRAERLDSWLRHCAAGGVPHGLRSSAAHR